MDLGKLFQLNLYNSDWKRNEVKWARTYLKKAVAVSVRAYPATLEPAGKGKLADPVAGGGVVVRGVVVQPAAKKLRQINSIARRNNQLRGQNYHKTAKMHFWLIETVRI